MNINKYFDNYLDITTKDDKTIHIENIYAHIVNHSSNNMPDYNGNINVFRKGNSTCVMTETYSIESNKDKGIIVRFACTEYENEDAQNNSNGYWTIEKSEDGSKEVPIFVIEKWDNEKSYLSSINNIKKINSDKIEKANARAKRNTLILKLLKRNKKGEVDLESLFTI